ncbi:MAG TPA: DNA repair protein RadC [Polyangiaceae bacterium]|nr:DNA repair protein RadC [Polyangiaceae bacterium]
MPASLPHPAPESQPTRDPLPLGLIREDRPRERLFIEGPSALSDVDLVALLLNTGTRGENALTLAAKLLQTFGGVRGLCQMSPRELERQRGVRMAKAARVLAAFELGRRASVPKGSDSSTVNCAADIEPWANAVLVPLDHEEVWLLCLDAKNQLLTRRRIGIGGLHGCALTPKDVLRPAIRDSASAIVLVHNHPSGDPTPSASDVQMTHVVASAARLVGLQLLDHVVVAAGGYASLYELGLHDGAAPAVEQQLRTTASPTKSPEMPGHL